MGHSINKIIFPEGFAIGIPVCICIVFTEINNTGFFQVRKHLQHDINRTIYQELFLYSRVKIFPFHGLLF